MIEKLNIPFKTLSLAELKSNSQLSETVKFSFVKCSLQEKEIKVSTYESIEDYLKSGTKGMLFIEINKNLIINNSVYSLKEYRLCNLKPNIILNNVSVCQPGFSKNGRFANGTHYVRAYDIILGLTFSFFTLNEKMFLTLEFDYSYPFRQIRLLNEIKEFDLTSTASGNAISLQYKHPIEQLAFIIDGLKTYFPQKIQEFNYEEYSFDKLLTHYKTHKTVFTNNEILG